jgi:hypothetical protein
VGVYVLPVDGRIHQSCNFFQLFDGRIQLFFAIVFFLFPFVFIEQNRFLFLSQLFNFMLQFGRTRLLFIITFASINDDCWEFTQFIINIVIFDSSSQFGLINYFADIVKSESVTKLLNSVNQKLIDCHPLIIFLNQRTIRSFVECFMALVKVSLCHLSIGRYFSFINKLESSIHLKLSIVLVK